MRLMFNPHDVRIIMTDLSATTNINSMVARRFAERNSRMAALATEQLSSGLMTSDPSRAPSEAAVGSRLEAKLSNLAQAQKNASQLTTMIQMGTGALKTQQDIITRMQALTTQANSDGVDDDNRLMLDQEFQQLANQLNLTAQTTRWGNTQLFNGSAASAVTNLGVVSESISVNAVANAFTNAYNATYTQGVIDGTVTDATVTANGNMFDITVKIGDKTFANTVAAPTAGGVLTLINTKDGTSSVAFNYHATDVTGFAGTAASFQTNLRSHLGVGTGSKSVATSASAAMLTNVTVTAGSAASSGSYAVTYTKSGTTGTFRISDGVNVYTGTANVAASASMTDTVTVGNFSLALAAFDGSATIATQSGFSVSNTSTLSMSGQVDSESGDTLSVTFTSANVTSLGLSGKSITSKANAVAAQAALKTAAASISNSIAQLGGKRSQLDFQVENLKISQANNAAAKSTYTDTNIAEASERLMKFKALSGIATSVFSQAIQDTQRLSQLVERLS